MSAQQEARKKRLEQAMKKNILRRKGDDIDIGVLEQKIEKFNKPITNNVIKNNFDYSQIIYIIIDLFAGGLTGLLIGFGFYKLYNSVIPMIILFAFGIMGGFYNITKRI